jgi:hypothetical protein
MREARRREPIRKCVRHLDENVLGIGKRELSSVFVASKVRYNEERFLDGLFWIKEGETSGSGFIFGAGFRAFADDFPEGTRLEVTAKVEVPK